MRTTLRDVALASGVSAMAVSKVLHGTGQSVRVSAETSEKIRRAAKELSYQPNKIARSLRSRKTSMVGVVFQHLDRLSDDNPYHPQLLSGIMSALFPHNYTLALCPKLVQGHEAGEIQDGRFDGILWARPDFTEASVEQLKNSKIPLVMLHAPLGALPGIPTFCIDNEMAMSLVVQHLAELGHRRITFVADLVNEYTTEGIARAGAFQKAAAEAGVDATVWFWNEKPDSFHHYWAQNPGITALAAFSDTLAGHILVACRQLQIKIPEDLSVVGFDSSTFCDRTQPPLTSLHQQVEKIAFDAATHLLALISGEFSEEQRSRPNFSLYPCKLDVRASTGKPSSWKYPNDNEK